MTNEDAHDDLLVFNGVDGATGEYGLPPMSGEELARFVRGAASPENLNELRFRHDQGAGHYGVKEGVDPKKLDEAGWGVVFTHDAAPEIREALAPLLDWRREQAGERFRIYAGEGGVRPGETKTKFLARHGAGPGPADPERVPYYLLLVGGPEAIPYRFQSQIDVQYAVGRICFETPQEYANYAASVVAAERGEVSLARRVSFFGVENADDKATRLSSRHLVKPLAKHVRAGRGDWEVRPTARTRPPRPGWRGCSGATRRRRCSSPPATAWSFVPATSASCRTRGPSCARTGRAPRPGAGRAASPRTSTSPATTWRAPPGSSG